MKTTKDFAGNPLQVGDVVAYQPSVYKGLKRGVISEISKSGKTVNIERGDCYRPVGCVMKVYTHEQTA